MALRARPRAWRGPAFACIVSCWLCAFADRFDPRFYSGDWPSRRCIAASPGRVAATPDDSRRCICAQYGVGRNRQPATSQQDRCRSHIADMACRSGRNPDLVDCPRRLAVVAGDPVFDHWRNLVAPFAAVEDAIMPHFGRHMIFLQLVWQTRRNL